MGADERPDAAPGSSAVGRFLPGRGTCAERQPLIRWTSRPARPTPAPSAEFRDQATHAPSGDAGPGRTTSRLQRQGPRPKSAASRCYATSFKLLEELRCGNEVIG
jgi:hypothetical protein